MQKICREWSAGNAPAASEPAVVATNCRAAAFAKSQRQITPRETPDNREPDMNFTDHVFTTMFEALSYALAAIVGKYAAVSGIVSPALRIAIVIYLSLLGYALTRGALQYPSRESAYRGCQLACLYF